MYSTTTSQQEMAIDVLRSMRKQESGGYKIPTNHLQSILQASSSSSSSLSSSSSHSEPSCYPQKQQQQQPEDEVMLTQSELSAYLTWRRQMIEWCYRIAETCKFAKETVEISVSLLDRYVATNPMIMLDSSCYQLSCMACLYTSCKTNEPTCLSPKQMEKISGCRFDNQALQIAEVTILKALNWRVNPPTAIAFARNLLDSQNLSKDFGLRSKQKLAVLDAVEIQIEQATADELFLPIRASGIALAAVLNAVRTHLPPSRLWKLETTLSQALGYELHTSYHRHQKVEKLQNALLALVALSHGYELCPPISCHPEDNDTTMMMMMMEEDAAMETYEAAVENKSPKDSDYFRPYSPKSVTI